MNDATPLISVATLTPRLGLEDLVVLDIREPAAYEAGHIPGSINSPYTSDGWRVTQGGGAGMLPGEAALAALFGRLGIAPSDHVVIVSNGDALTDFSGAARVYWTFRIARHGRISILNGGYAAWAKAGGEIETKRSSPKAAAHYPVTFDPALRATLDEVARAIDTKTATLVDGRSAASFEGREKSPQAARAGRLPGALNLDHTIAYDPQAGALKPIAELEALYAPVPEGDVVSYCNTGHLASTNWFILSELLQRPDVRLYDGSMSEWSADDSRPVETGPAKP